MSSQTLTHDALHRRAPAIFAEAPDAGVSEQYGFVPTINVVEALEQEGWYPVHARQTVCRDPERKPVARHLIRLRQDPGRQVQVGDSIPELVLTNSHDRSASFQLELGLFRLICANGMVTPAGALGAMRVRHGRHVVDSILEHSVELVGHLPRIAERVEAFRTTPISRGEEQDFARQALRLRYGENWQRLSPVDPETVLEARRQEDAEGTIWSVFSRVQENLLKGGLRGRSGTGRRTRTRAIRSVGEDVRLNRGLWNLTEQLAERRGVALAA